MILPDFKDFPRHGRLFGIDWGERRIGIAVSDDTREFVWVRPLVDNKAWSRDAVAKIATQIDDEKVVGIIIGLPIRMDGTESTTTMAVRGFASALSTYTELPIAFIEENLTSVAAGEVLGKKQTKENLDSVSAKIILENAIAMIKRQTYA